MSNIIPARAKPEMVDRITPNFQRGTVLIPFQGLNGSHVVIEITRRQWLKLIGDIEEAWSRLRRRDETDAMILDIDRHDRLV